VPWRYHGLNRAICVAVDSSGRWRPKADPSNVIQHDFGFPRVIRAEDAERAALYAMLVSLGATKMMAERLIQDYAQYRIAAQFNVDFARDGESDMRGAIAKLEEEPEARRRWRGGAT
jgi:hypothetical protein